MFMRVLVSLFQAIARSDQEVPFGFTEGKTSLIPKAGGIFP